jgi:superfamily II DNA or RNA helicase
MSLTRALVHEFSNTSRARGDAYAAAGRVTIVSADEGGLVAMVRGGERYQVLIQRVHRDDGQAFRVDCECPHYLDHLVACKHIWATLRVAEERALLGDPDDAHPRAYIELLADKEHGDEEYRPDELDEFEERSGRIERLRGRGAAVGVRPPSPGARFLGALEADNAGPEALNVPQVFRYAAGELLYILDEIATTSGSSLMLTVMWRKRKQNGEWGKPQPAPIGAQDITLAPPADRALLAPLVGASPFVAEYGAYGFAGNQGATFTLSDVLADIVVPAAARTGRLVVRSATDAAELVPLAWDDGPPWQFQLDVIETPTGYRIVGAFHRGDVRFNLDGSVRIALGGFVVAGARIARLTFKSPGEARLIAALRSAGEVEFTQEHAGSLALALARAGVSHRDLPEALRFAEIDVAPVPRLRLTSDRRAAYGQLSADLDFDYAGSVVPVGGPPLMADGPARRLIRRRTDVEHAALARLTGLGLRQAYDYRQRRMQHWLAPTHLPRVVRTLVAEGWRVEADGKAWRAPGAVRLSVTTGIDWFDLDATVTFGATTARLADVVGALKRGEQRVVLGDGSVGMLPEDWLAKYAPLVAVGTETNDGKLRFRQPQTALLDALLAAQAASASVAFDEGFRLARDELTRFDRLTPADPPASFRGALRDYQCDALGWFQYLRRFRFGGCLADDMGLGKTVMVLALLAWWQEVRARSAEDRRASVIVVPRSLVSNWMNEAARFAPNLRVVDYSGGSRAEQRDMLEEADVVLTTYGTLRRDVVHLKDLEFEYVVLDEAQSIKNANTASAKASRLLRGRHRLALSGTPLENHLGELWSVFEFLNPGLLGASTLFQRATSRIQPDAETVNLLARGLRPFILRRTKQQVARELPARTEQTIPCELDAQARAAYDGLRRHYRDVLLKRVEREGLAKSKMHVLEALLRLRQAACHPGLIDPEQRSDSCAKFDVLLPRLREVVAEGHKALVFSQFTSFLGLLRTTLDAEGLVYEYLDGRTRDRASRIEHFQQDRGVGLFLISLKAGGLGLNLTAAEYVFLLDPWWNPAVEAQAIDRTHRIGQTREVFAYRLIARGTVEEKVLDLQQSKRALADAVLSADAVGLKHLKREDLELLLS